MRIHLATLGSRGDVQPFLVLAAGLRARGHDVLVAAPRNFADLARSYDLPFTAFDADFQALADDPELRARIGKNPLRIGPALREKVYPVYRSALEQGYALCRDADRYLYHPKTLADHFSDALGERMVRAYVVPAFTPTRAFGNPAFSGLPLPRPLRRASYRLNDLLMGTMRRPIRAFREAAGLPARVRRVATPVLYGISPSFLPRPADYPPDHVFTGFWLDDSDGPLAPELSAFLDAHPRSLLLTFGSMPVTTRVPLPALVRALADRVDAGIVVVEGWGLQATPELRAHERVFVTPSAPYGALLPRLAAAVHHGGAGTVAHCLRAGTPMMVCPVLHPVGDQMFWGHRAAELGLAVPPVPAKALDAEKLVAGVRRLLDDEGLRERAGEMAARVAAEDGVAAAIERIEG